MSNLTFLSILESKRKRKKSFNTTPHEHNTRHKAQNHEMLIDLDDEDEIEETVIDLDDNQSDVIVLDDELNDKENMTENSACQENNTSNPKKSNMEIEVPESNKRGIATELCTSNLEPHNNDLNPHGNEQRLTETNKTKDASIKPNESQFLVARKIGECNVEETRIEKVKHLENRIALYKKQIERLDAMEVEDDTNNSPYIISEK